MIRRALRTLLFLSFFLIFFTRQPLHAQWGADSVTNTVVCDTVGLQDYPQICSDGSDGAIVVWEDERSNIFAIYAQHLDANGYATWTRNGVKLAQSSADERYPIIASDGSGGAYVVWQDDRNANEGIDLYGQHISANGTLSYSNAGTAVASASGNQDNAAICSDGKGNAYVAWEDSRNSTVSSRPDIYLNRMTSGGTSFGSGGIVVDDMAGRQVGPAVCPDGTGGCYVAWENDNLIPSGIYARRISSSGAMLWGQPPPSHGVQIYQAGATANNPQPNSSDVSISLDSNQLLLAWEVTNPTTADGQDILAERMNCTTTSDTTLAYPDAPVHVTGTWINSQITPQIFSDDSLLFIGSSSLRGMMVPFLDLEPGSTDDYDVAMVRVLGDGVTTVPAVGNGFSFFEQQPHAQTGFKAIMVPGSNSAQSGLIAVWNDGRYAGLGLGKDTTIFAQRMDRNGHRYFPANVSTNGTKVAEPLCSGPGANGWIATQVDLAPRSDGGIAVWTDFRKGTNNASIYAQLIRMDGSLWVPHDTTTPILSVIANSPSDNDSQCNAQCTTVLAIDPGTIVDTGTLKSGIDSVIPVAMNNMQIDSSGFQQGATSVTFTVCVIDSFQNGSGTATVKSEDSKTESMSFTYCTIPDTKAPVILVDTLAIPALLAIQISDNGAWDRGIKSIIVSNAFNIHFSDSGATFIPGVGLFFDTANIIADSLAARFTIKAMDSANNTSTYSFNYSPQSGVSVDMQNPIVLSVFPNPTNGDATVQLAGAAAADVTISDVLGRTVDHFHLEGSHDWQARVLAPGTYIVRALIGNVVICKRIVRE